MSNLEMGPMERFKDMAEHCEECGELRLVMADQTKLLVVVRCGCEDSWAWRLMELRTRKPSTELVDRFFKDDGKRRVLEMWLNGVMVLL